MPLDTVETREAYMQGLRAGVTMFRQASTGLRDKGYLDEARAVEVLADAADRKIEAFATAALLP